MPERTQSHKVRVNINRVGLSIAFLRELHYLSMLSSLKKAMLHPTLFIYIYIYRERERERLDR